MRWLNKSNFSSSGAALKKNAKLFLYIPAAILLILIAALFIVAKKDSSDDKSDKQAYLLLADYKKYKVHVMDSTGQQLTVADFPYPSSYVTQHAVTPDGAVLLSVGQGSSKETFFFANQKQKFEISKEAGPVVAASTAIGGKHNIVFISNDTAIFTQCPAGETCKLSRINLKTGKSDLVAESGVVSSAFGPVYLLGASSDRKSVYVAVSGANKFSSDTRALYKLDLLTKKPSLTVKLPFDAGQNISLSPDEKTLVYKTGGLGKEVEIKLVDIATSNETKIAWQKAEVANAPSTFVWSPDSKKALFLSSANITRSTAAADNPQKLAYVDIDAKKVVELQTISKTYLNNIAYYSWLDKNSIIYKQIKTAKENDYASATREIYKQEVDSKKVSRVESPNELLEVILW